MSLNQTPMSERIHIGIFGRRNAGKSSLVNALTGQGLSIVSNVPGTTTDPVSKAMELLPLGPVVMIDTPGMDDEGELGALRVRKTFQVLNKTDLAVLVCDARKGVGKEERALFEKIKQKRISWLLVLNKTDLLDVRQTEDALEQAVKALTGLEESAGDGSRERILAVSAADDTQIYELKEKIARMIPDGKSRYPIVSDLLEPLDLVVLVVPIDKAAPKGRLILPQQQTIRDILDAGALAVVVRDYEYAEALKRLKRKPKLVITDSQVFDRVAQETPKDIRLTSFSILFARYKGQLEVLVRGAGKLDKCGDGDRILISEGCTHHRQCDDIGTVKLPGLIRKYTKAQPEFCFTSGGEFPEDLSGFRLVIHCGGCMLSEREMKYRIACAVDADVPVTNYGMAIAHMNGILERSLEIFQASLFDGNRV